MGPRSRQGARFVVLPPELRQWGRFRRPARLPPPQSLPPVRQGRDRSQLGRQLHLLWKMATPVVGIPAMVWCCRRMDGRRVRRMDVPHRLPPVKEGRYEFRGADSPTE